MTIHGNATKFTAYLFSIVDLLSITLLDQCAFFSGASSQGGLYKCELSTKTVTLPCSEINQICALNGKVLYTDTKAAKVMQYNPDDNSARALVGSDHNSSSDGTQDSCSFKQLEGICSVDKTLFVTDVSSGKVSFLGILGSLYDTFGIHSKGMKPEGVSLKQAKENVTTIDNYVKDTVSKVKERYQLSETSASNGPQGTISKMCLFLKRMDRLYSKVMDVNT